MLIRQLTAEDAVGYQQLRLRGLQESPTAFGASYATEVKRSPSEIADRIKPAIDGSKCMFGAFIDGEIIGMLVFMRRPTEKLHHNADLAGMYVAPEFRRRGVAGMLLDRIIAHARSVNGLRQLFLSVNATNTAARLLYESRGFKRYGIEPETLYVDGRYYDEEHYYLRIAPTA